MIYLVIYLVRPPCETNPQQGLELSGPNSWRSPSSYPWS